MTGPLLYVYKLPPVKGAEFEARLPAALSTTPLRQELKDRVALLALLMQYKASGVYEGSQWISLDYAEIVERCVALPNENSGPVVVAVGWP